MSTLFEINGSMLEILNNIEQAEGEITEEMEAKLLITEEQLQEKSQGYLSIIKNNEAYIDQVDKEIERLSKLKKSKKSVIDRLKNNLLTAVEVFGEYEAGLNVVGFRKSTSVQVESVESLPDIYTITKKTKSADKTAIKKALQSGEIIEGCEIIESKNLKIK